MKAIIFQPRPELRPDASQLMEIAQRLKSRVSGWVSGY